MSTGRHVATRTPRGRSQQIFSGRRTLAVACIGLILAFDLVGAGLYVTRSNRTPSQVAPINSDVGYPRRLADAINRCQSLPMLGAGVVRRVVTVYRKSGSAYAYDPFNGRLIRQLTRLEQHETSSCDYALDHYGEVPDRTIALTYDDGPDPFWTRRILEVLRSYGVPATFFVVGRNVVDNPELFAEMTKSEVIGNHTLNHPELDRLSDEAGRHELLTTDRIIAATGKYRTRLFRIPYGGGDPASVRKSLRGILEAQQLGLTEVNFTIDAADFKYTGGRNIPLPLLRGKGEVIVMHDGGGDRSATLRYTIQLIQLAQANGYRFITVDQLVKGWHPAGPEPPTVSDHTSYWTTWAQQTLVTRVALRFLWWCTLATFAITLGSIVLALFGSSRHRRKWHRLEQELLPEKRYPRLVSVLVAGKNEQAGIEEAIRRVFSFDYPFAIQLVAVDDGSTDATGEILDRLQAEFDHYPRKLVVAHIPNGGKAKALNYALLPSQGGLVKGSRTVTIDADTLVDAQTIPKLVRHFHDPYVGAVAGRVKVLNQGSNPWQRLLTSWQSAEYNMGIGLTRMAQAGIGAIMIVPGACSAWRTSAVIALGGFPLDTNAEDADLGMMMRWKHLRVVQELEAVAYTEAPITFRALKKQQLRWTFGIYQVVFKHCRMLLHPVRFGALSWFVLPNAIASTAIPTIVLPLNLAISIFACILGRWELVLLYLALFTLNRVVMSTVAMIVLREWSWDPLTALFYRLLNDPLQMYLAWRSAGAIATGKPVAWAKVPRMGDQPNRRADAGSVQSTDNESLEEVAS